MNRRNRMTAASVLGVGFVLAGAVGYSQAGGLMTPSKAKFDVLEERMAMAQATGEFDVKMIPQPPDEVAGSGLGRMVLDKKFHGELDAISKGQMLAARTAVKDSAGYVALEVVTGTLAGKKGTFVLQHSGTMNRGIATLVLTVVPDSGTDELVGLTGKMDIVNTNGKHSYIFDYALPG